MVKFELMSTQANLDTWAFLIGSWKGTVEENVVDEGNVNTKGVYDLFPSARFIRCIDEAHNEEGLVNQSVSFLYVDTKNNCFIRKSVFSYGFVNNEVSYNFDEESIFFDIVVEPIPKQWEQISWRSYIKKISEDEIEQGLLQSEKNEEFKIFNKSMWTRQV